MSGVLWEAETLGIEERRGGLDAYFAAWPAAGLLARLRRAGARSVARRVEPDKDWVAECRARIRPVRVGRLLIAPPWSRARAPAGGWRLVIDPARAFGTGGHESTRLVLAALVAERPRRSPVLDIGCGTGVLALASLRLGARRAVALDIDPEAVAAAASNACRNGVRGALDVVLGGPEAVRARFPLVLANLTAPLLVGHAPDIADRVAPGGELVVSGFLLRDETAVAAAFAARGLRAQASAGEGEWRVLRLGKARGSPR